MPNAEEQNGRVLALIPAKGGSTRLLRKNLILLGGRPLVSWTIEAARDAGGFQRIVVSTEDTEVERAALKAGAEVPFRRPTDLAIDPAGVVQVALHALDALEAQGDRFDVLVILLPTCPLRSSGDIVSAMSLFRTRPEANLMSVGPFGHTPFNAVGIGEDGILFPHFPEHFGRKSQDMPLSYRPNGALHILDVEWFREHRSYLDPPVLAFPMPPERSVDIDTAEDLALAEYLLERRAAQVPQEHA